MSAVIDHAILTKPRLTCRLCGSTTLQLVVPMESIPRGDAYVPAEKLASTQFLFPHGVNFCHACGHVQTMTDVDQSLIYRHYLWTTGISPGLAASYREYVDEVVGRFLPDGRGFAVEIGCNDGTFARLLQARGLDVLGVEPASNLAERLAASGVPTICEFFDAEVASDIVRDRGRADLVVANHVFANINDNDDIMAGVKTLLALDGVFSVQVFYLYDVMRSMLLENFNHEHPSYMYVRSLRAYFARHGMELFDVRRVETKGGSIRCFVQHKGGQRPVSSDVQSFVDREEAMGLHDPATYGALREHIARTREAFAAYLEPVKQRGGSIAAYGTSIGATVFTYQYGLGKYLDFFVDDDPTRHDLVSPGYGIPVLSSQAIYERKPELVVITAPLYATIIVEKHKAFLDQGGKFLVFRPHFEVISSR